LNIQTQHKCLTEKATLSVRPRFEVPSPSTIPTSSEGIAYTVTVYSDANILARKRTLVYDYERTVRILAIIVCTSLICLEQLIDVEFSGRTAGGNPSHPTFMYNPQYRVDIKPDISGRAEKSTANVKCQLVGDDQSSYNVKLVWNQGERVTEYDYDAFIH
jgi:calpain-7